MYGVGVVARNWLATTTAPLKGRARSAVGKATGAGGDPLLLLAEVSGPAVWSKIEKSLTRKVLRRNPPALPIEKAALPLIVKIFWPSTVTPISPFEIETSSAPLGWRVIVTAPVMSSTPATLNLTPVPTNEKVLGAMVWPPTVRGCGVVLTWNVAVPWTTRPSRPTRAIVPDASRAYCDAPPLAEVKRWKSM